MLSGLAGLGQQGLMNETERTDLDIIDKTYKHPHLIRPAQMTLAVHNWCRQFEKLWWMQG
jgi:hypothetical protein